MLPLRWLLTLTTSIWNGDSTSNNFKCSFAFVQNLRYFVDSEFTGVGMIAIAERAYSTMARSVDSSDHESRRIWFVSVKQNNWFKHKWIVLPMALQSRSSSNTIVTVHTQCVASHDSMCDNEKYLENSEYSLRCMYWAIHILDRDATAHSRHSYIRVYPCRSTLREIVSQVQMSHILKVKR